MLAIESLSFEDNAALLVSQRQYVYKDVQTDFFTINIAGLCLWSDFLFPKSMYGVELGMDKTKRME